MTANTHSPNIFRSEFTKEIDDSSHIGYILGYIKVIPYVRTQIPHRIRMRCGIWSLVLWLLVFPVRVLLIAISISGWDVF